MIFAEAPQLEVLSNQPAWAVACAGLVVMCIILLVARFHIWRLENPLEEGHRLFLVAYDYPGAADWCWQNNISTRDPRVVIITRKHQARGWVLTLDDRVVDLGGPRTAIANLESTRPPAR